MLAMRTSELGLIVVSVFVGCVKPVDPARPESPPPTEATGSLPGPATPAVDAEQAAALKAIATTYASHFQKVSPWLNVAPTLCAALPHPPTMELSQSGDASPHGKKLYFLYASHADVYVKDGGRPGTSQPADQVIVKESWKAVSADAGDAGHDPSGGSSDVVDTDGKHYRAGERGSLFVMARHGDGWRFGLVAPDGTPTTEGPATQSCHGCHDAKPDGLFGLKRASR